ncbi:MAG TPA: SEC-C metal-binding domain-containing protein [Phycisphaerae bacterium]|nr:SEC-C metal-binding domain-containing protein [Phycisphaerae bacterium]
MAKSGDKFEKHFERKRKESEDYKKTLPGEDEAPLPPPVETIRKAAGDIGRNDPCACGSGKKYKQCCLVKKAPATKKKSKKRS